MKLYLHPAIPISITVILVGAFLGNKQLNIQQFAQQVHGFVSLVAIISFLLLVLIILNYLKNRSRRNEQRQDME